MDDFEAAAVKWNASVVGQHAKATLQRDPTEHHGGDAALRVYYDFVGKKDYEYIQLNGAATFERPDLGFGFWFKSDGTPFQLRLRFVDASGEWHQTDLFHSDKAGWQFVAGAIDAHSSAWGGDGNRRKDYPCKLAGICVDRPRVGFVTRGSVWIDDAAIRCVRSVILNLDTRLRSWVGERGSAAEGGEVAHGESQPERNVPPPSRRRKPSAPTALHHASS